MATQACPHCRSNDLLWFGSLPEWIAAVDAHGIAYDSQVAHEMSTATNVLYWLCHNCGQGGMAVGDPSTLGKPQDGGPATLVTAPVVVRGARHLVSAHTAAYAREHCDDYRKAFAMIAPDIKALRESSGQDKDGGDDAVFEALAGEAVGNWRDTAKMTLCQATVGDLPAALRMAACFTHAFADVLWDELGEPADDACGADDEERLNILVAMWLDLNAGKANKPVSRKAKQKAEAKARAQAARRGR